MEKFIPKIKKFVFTNKIVSVAIIIIVVALGWCWFSLNSSAGASRYVSTAVQKGAIIVSVSGSGQVEATEQIDLKPKVSGAIIWLGASAGQTLYQWQAIAAIDNIDIQKSITSAKIDIAQTKLQLAQSTAQAPIDYQRKLETLATEKDDLAKQYEQTFNSISNVFINLPTVMTGVQNVLYGYDLNTMQWNVDVYHNFFRETADYDLVNSFSDIAEKDYLTAKTAYDKNFNDFKTLTRYSNDQAIQNQFNETLDTTKAIAQAIKSEINLLDTVVNIAQNHNSKINPVITNFQSSLNNYLSTVNSSLNSLLSQSSSLANAKSAIINTERDIEILKVGNSTGDNPISLQIARNNLAQKEQNLTDLEAQLADYTIRMPFDGTVAKVSVKKGDTISSGTAVATVITKRKVASISLNEVDVAKIKVGQKATLIFDAVENLSITGEVSEIDTIGTISQGVVNYGVKIVFDTQDGRIKSGMSVSSAIITDAKQDVLVIANSAVKTQGNINYVEVLNQSTNLPQQVRIDIGLANDTQTEIIDGLKEGDRVITQTITGISASTNQAGVSSGLRIPGISGGGGGFR